MTNRTFSSLFLVISALCARETIAFSSNPLFAVGRSLLSPSENSGSSTHSQLVVSSTTSSSSTEITTPLQSIDTHLIVGCFGRLADKSFVLAPSEIQGTAASGYEFGVLESGRPKWICSYASRTGATQGGGADMTHVPTWRSVLFGDDSVVLTKNKLATVLLSETTKFEMPLGASPGAKMKAAKTFTDDDCEQVMDRLWQVLGGGEGIEELSKQDVSNGLETASAEFGSKSDSMVYSVFEKAMKA